VIMKIWVYLTVIFALALSMDGIVRAHEVRPGYLQIKQLDVQTYDLLWKVPAKGDRRIGLYVRLPIDCRNSQAASRFAGGSYIERWRATCEGGLNDGTIAIDGLEATRTDVLVRVEHSNGHTQTVRLIPSRPDFKVTGAAGPAAVIRTYFRLGVEHILLGFDHLLFILALVFLVQGWRRLLATITAFTVAHSLTLAAATFGWLQVPQAPVEAVIALSIMFVAAGDERGSPRANHGLWLLRSVCYTAWGLPGLCGRWVCRIMPFPWRWPFLTWVWRRGSCCFWPPCFYFSGLPISRWAGMRLLSGARFCPARC